MRGENLVEEAEPELGGLAMIGCIDARSTRSGHAHEIGDAG